MSGYRLIHREQVLDAETAVWALMTTPLICRRPSASLSSEPPGWRIWAACSDGYIHAYLVKEVSLSQKETSLTASALRFDDAPSHILKPSTDSAVALGCASMDILRNYAGEDDAAGNVMVAAMDLSGILRIWQFDENADEHIVQQQQQQSALAQDSATTTHVAVVRPVVELSLSQATGTTVALAPPRTILPHLQVLLVAVAYLDGSVALVSTGIPVPTAALSDDAKAELPEAGTVVESWGSGSALACRLVFRPNVAQLAVSRQDGTVDLIPIQNNSSNGVSEPKQRLHRLSNLATSPCRGLAFTTDGSLMIAGNDEGRLVLWDVTRPNGVPAVVNHQTEAVVGDSWLWQLSPLDGRRFVSLGTDKSVRVWQVDQVHHQPLHSFTSSDDIRMWAISIQALESNTNPHPPRLVTGSENGWFQIYSLVDKA